MTRFLFFFRLRYRITLLMVCGILFMSAAPSSETTYTYRIRINAVTDPVSFKETSPILEPIFDVLPHFDDDSDTITIISIYHVSQEALTRKLAEFGYTLTVYQLIRNNETPK